MTTTSGAVSSKSKDISKSTFLSVKEMLVDKFRKLGFDIDHRIEIRESDQYGKHICATEKIEKGK